MSARQAEQHLGSRLAQLEASYAGFRHDTADLRSWVSREHKAVERLHGQFKEMADTLGHLLAAADQNKTILAGMEPKVRHCSHMHTITLLVTVRREAYQFSTSEDYHIA